MAGLGPSESSDDLASLSQINVTPFVDVVLVLLVIFMVTAPIVMKDMLRVNLPKSSTAESSTQSPLAISITKDGDLLVYGKLTSEVELQALIKERLAQDPSAQAILAADVEAKHGYLVKTMDLLRSLGLSRFAIEVERQNP